MIDGLIGLVERNTIMWRYWGEGAEPLVSIDGDPVVFALLARSIWDAIVESATEPPGSVASLLETAFGGTPSHTSSMTTTSARWRLPCGPSLS